MEASQPTTSPLPPQLQAVLSQAHEHHASGRLQIAENLYRQVLGQQPENADALHHLGLIAFQCRQYAPAIELMSRSVALDPSQSFFFRNLASACRAAGRLDEAERWLRQAIARAPQDPAVHEELAILLQNLDRLDEAIAEHRYALEAIARGTDAGPVRAGLEATAQMNLGAALQRLGRFEEALPHLDRAIELAPDHAMLHTHRANILFRLRDLPAAWAEYEWRFKCKGFPTPWPKYPQPAWDGSPLNGRTILLWPEQGFGDVIQFARFVPAVLERGGSVVLQCMPELTRVLRSLPWDIQVVSNNDPLPSFDFHLPLISVPRALGTTYESIPTLDHYLSAEQSLSAEWANKLGIKRARLRIGLSWSGSSNFAGNARRSVRLNDLLPLADIPGIEWHSLQLGEAARELPTLAQQFPIIDHSKELHDFADTAALLDNLDLLISTDTAVVHLAGAMAKETWVMLWSERDFRWLMDDTGKKWYPSVRTFLQERMGQWAEVVQRLKRALETR